MVENKINAKKISVKPGRWVYRRKANTEKIKLVMYSFFIGLMTAHFIGVIFR